MKSITFNLLNTTSLTNIVIVLTKLLKDKKNKLEVVVRNRKDSATHAQFKAIFGVWFEYLQDKYGVSKKYLHQQFKKDYLVRIYSTSPQGVAQECWADSVIYWTEKDIDKALEKTKQISLSWATKEQMCMYMRDIELYYIDIGQPLPPIESEEQRKTYERYCERLGI